MNILFIPLDERPCNCRYPQDILKCVQGVNLITPDASILNKMKQPAKIDALWEFVEQNIKNCEAAILSVDMLVYGGLVPSRLHHESVDVLMQRCARIGKLKTINSAVKLYGFDCVMRIPSYNSNLEEPEYYGTYGRRIFELSEFKHKNETGILTSDEQNKMNKLLSEIPEEYVTDYFERRKKNAKVTSLILDEIKSGLFEQFIIPQDDTAVYGVQVLEQQDLIKKAAEHNLQNKVFVYPGADEVGLTLLCKALLDFTNKALTVYIRYSSLTGRFVVPGFEDRPYEETIKWQLISAGLTIVDTAADADIILMVNVPGEKQYDTTCQFDSIRENYSKRNLLEFVRSIKHYSRIGKHIAVADVAYSNGGDLELLKLLHLENALPCVKAYAGWNTDANTLGTTICFGVATLLYGENNNFLLYRLLEDVGYQSIVRSKLQAVKGDNDFAVVRQQLEATALEQLNAFRDEFLSAVYANLPKLVSVSFPWQRLFEIELHFES